jgi:quercetin dioxygenase-like cupin family protein
MDEIRLGAMTIRFLLEGAQSGGSLAVFRFEVPAGTRVPIPHSHDAYEETMYGLVGVLRWTLDGVPTDVGPGEVLCVRRGVVHHFENATDADATALAMVSPGVLGPRYFRELAAILAGAGGGPPDPRRRRGDHAPSRPDARPGAAVAPAARPRRRAPRCRTMAPAN